MPLSVAGYIAVYDAAGNLIATDPASFFSGVPGTTNKYAEDIGNGVAVSFVVTHNLNTRDVDVIVRRNSAPYDRVFPGIEMTSVNTVTLLISPAPTSNQFRVIVLG